jgi:diguanylate cyclase (GGDEF)-like protein
MSRRAAPKANTAVRSTEQPVSPSCSRRLGALAWAGLLLMPLCAQAQPSSSGSTVAALQTRLDEWVQRGYDEPDAALAALADLGREPLAAPLERRLLALSQGLVAVAAGRSAAGAQALTVLTTLAPTDALAAADSSLVRATLADMQGESALALAAAQAAQQAYQSVCPTRPGCDHRSSWRALTLMARHADRRGQASAAAGHALAAAELARGAGDPWRHAWALAQAADLSGQDGDRVAEQRLLGQSQRLARLQGSKSLISRVSVYETRILSRNNDVAGAIRSAESGAALARQAHSPRLLAVHLTNLSDLAVRAGRPRDALAAVQWALPIVRKDGNRRGERTLINNQALAHIALGQSQAAHATLQTLLAAHRASGGLVDEAETLREFSDAFAAAGDLKTALALFHQERKLSAEIMAANRETALAELRARFDREAQQRRLDQMGHASRLMSVQLENRATLQKVWAASALALVLAVALVAQLYQRVRGINRRLATNQAFLRAQSQRDPLTGLANRRGLMQAVQAQGVQEQFSGALLLVDIDHFKQVNDGHGHAVGDAVLVHVAQRLAAVVRDNDIVARWGGEEFLIFMPAVGALQAQALAERVLQTVGGTPVALPDAAPGALRVTVSLGYGSFPLPPARLPLTLERAINLADMALYTAKSQGRNRAVGISAASADEDEALRRIESDFDQAWHQGSLTLQRTQGPAVPEPQARAALQPA